MCILIHEALPAYWGDEDRIRARVPSRLKRNNSFVSVNRVKVRFVHENHRHAVFQILHHQAVVADGPITFLQYIFGRFAEVSSNWDTKLFLTPGIKTHLFSDTNVHCVGSLLNYHIKTSEIS